MVETETKTETWKKFESKTRGRDLKKFSRPQSRLGEFVQDRDETSRREILEAKLKRRPHASMAVSLTTKANRSFKSKIKRACSGA